MKYIYEGALSGTQLILYGSTYLFKDLQYESTVTLMESPWALLEDHLPIKKKLAVDGSTYVKLEVQINLGR